MNQLSTPNERLKAYLDNNGIKYGFVAKKSGIPLSTFSEILSGKRRMTACHAEKICQAMQISAEVIIPTTNEKETA